MSIADDVAETLSTITRPAAFCVAGTEQILAPGLTVQGVGPVALPLIPMQAQQLIAAAERAPFGRGEATLTDLDVRRTWQIGAGHIRFTGKHWPGTLSSIVARIKEQFGVEGEVTAELYKLLIYDTGSFFLPHRDTEKQPGMFATLVVALPSVAEGGELIVSHNGREMRMELRCEEPSDVAFAAFYADCVHEVRPVTAGYRLVAVYNLVRHGRTKLPKPPEYGSEQTRLAAVLGTWREATPGDANSDPVKLIYPLAHAYTEAELGFAALKGADKSLADLVVAAAEAASCDVHLALISVEDSSAAEYAGPPSRGRYGRYHDEDDEAENYEAGELYDRTAVASHWRRIDDTPAPLGALPIFEEEFSPPVDFDELEPDEQHFHEATGNAGATLERLYSRAALILWPRAGSLAVINQGGRQVALPYLSDLAKQWRSRRDDAVWNQAHVLSGHIQDVWNMQDWRPCSGDGPSDAGLFLDSLVQLGDMVRIDTFLQALSGRNAFDVNDAPAIVAALRELTPARAAELARGLVRGAKARAFAACAKLLAELSVTNANLAREAAHVLVADLPGDPRRPAKPAWPYGPGVTRDSVADLVAALVRVEPPLAVSAAETMCSRPATYDPDDVLVPAAKTLVATPDIADSSAVAIVRAASLRHLDTRIALPLDPPADWQRDAVLGCKCQDCSRLTAFLVNPAEKIWVFAAAEARRRHMEDTIRHARSDVTTATERTGSPHKLVCTKSQASYERRCQQRQQDLASVKTLRAKGDLAHDAG